MKKFLIGLVVIGLLVAGSVHAYDDRWLTTHSTREITVDTECTGSEWLIMVDSLYQPYRITKANFFRFTECPVAGDVTNSFINIGDYTTAIAVAPTTANMFGVMHNVTLTDIDVAYWYQAYYTKITTAGTTDATSIAGHAYRINIASDLEAAYGIQCHTNITAGADITQEVISVSSMVDLGTGATTSDRVVALQAMVTGSGTAGTVTGLLHVASFVNAGTVIDTDAIVFVSNQSAATSDVAIEFDLDGTCTNVFEFNGTAPDAYTTGDTAAEFGAFDEYVLIPVTVEGVTPQLYLIAAETWQSVD